jgi:WD40 repeat protein
LIVAACSDGKPFYTAADGGSIRKYPISVDDLTQTTYDVLALKQSPITCVDPTSDTGASNTFIIECADGNLHLCSPNGLVEKSVPAQTGGMTRVLVNGNGLSIASGGEDGVLKIWSWNGIIRANSQASAAEWRRATGTTRGGV